MFAKYASVILDVAVDKMLDYGITLEQVPLIKQGVRVEVPVRGQLRGGYVYAVKDTPDHPKVQGIAKVISDQELITPELFDLALWMAKYYCCQLRQVLKLMLPASVRRQMAHKEQLFVMRAMTKEALIEAMPALRKKSPIQAQVIDVMLTTVKGMLLTELLEESDASRSAVDALVKKGMLVVDIVRIDRSPLVNEQYFQTKPKQLNAEQAEALSKISASLEEGLYSTHVLFGVTGSGKTEVYLQAIDRALSLGKGTLMLVPEIALTAQTIERFRSRFEGQIAVLHHRLSHGERFDEWNRIRKGEARIVIGARSAVFSPIENLGLIIIDEEHESSYKQTDEPPCYNARDVAVMRGNMARCTVILGSATPSIESFYNAKQSKYILSVLTRRAEKTSLPTFTIIDMKREYERNKGYTNFSEQLLDGIKRRAQNGEQTILFLNRRGYHTTLLCQKCSHAVKCQHCDVALTFHLGENALACHFCGFTVKPPPKNCPACQAPEPMKYKGVGTEQIEKALYAVLPDIRVIRIDADTTKHKGSHQKLLRAFGCGKADVLLGTQMIAKGLHFPQVTLVGVLNSDSSLNIPDFRSSETVFQLITQVAGRAGRGVTPGEVFVQTSLPDNATIQHAAAQDYLKFYNEEIEIRKLFRYPPFSQLIKLAFSGPVQQQTLEVAMQVRAALQQQLSNHYELNPVIPAGHVKVRDKYRYQFIVRGPGVYPITKAIEELRKEIKLPDTIKLLVDVNPLSTFF